MIALYILIGLQIADLASTLVALKNPKLREANKVLVWLFGHFGVAPTLIGAKVLFIAFIWWAYPHIVLEGGEWVLWPLSAFYAYIVFNNVRHIRRVSEATQN